MEKLERIVALFFCVIALPSYSQIHKEEKPAMRRTNSCRDLKELLEKDPSDKKPEMRRTNSSTDFKQLLENDPFTRKSFEQPSSNPVISNNNNSSKEEIREVDLKALPEIMEQSFDKMLKRFNPLRRVGSVPTIPVDPSKKLYELKKQPLTRSVSVLSPNAYAITSPGPGLVAIHNMETDQEVLTLNSSPWKTHTSFASPTSVAYIRKPQSAVCVIDVPTGKDLNCTDFKVIDYNTSTYEIPQIVSGPQEISEGKKPYPVTVKGLNNDKILMLYRSTSTITNREKGGLLYLWNVEAKTFTELDPYAINIDSALLAPNNQLIDTKDKKIRLFENPGQRTESIKTISKHTARITGISLAASLLNSAKQPQQLILASGSEDKTVKLWDLGTYGSESATFGFPKKVTSLAFHPEVDYLLAVAASDTIYFVDTRAKTTIGSSPLGDMCKNNIVRTLKWNQNSLYAEVGLRLWSKLTDLNKMLPSGKNLESTVQSQ